MANAPPYSPAERAALARITPKRTSAIVDRTIRKAQAALHGASVVLGGSLAKGTHLAGDHDIDVFVRYPPKSTGISDRTQQGLEKAFRAVERVHGSRDYFHVRAGAYTFEFVPVLKISSWKGAKNVTDMSPLHVQYVQKHTRAHPQLTSEIRLVKQFCKAARVYGAESYIGGFSGHVVDLLTIQYGGFRALLTAAAVWPDRLVLDPEHHHKDPLRALNASKTHSPLILVDPMQPERNSAAAVSREAYEMLRTRARAYLAAPAAKQAGFFVRTPLTRATIAKQYPRDRVLVCTLTPLRGKQDVVGAKCRKVFDFCLGQLREHEFDVNAAHWEFTPARAHLYFVVDKKLLSLDRIVAGPPIRLHEHVKKFKREHTRTFTKNGRIYAREKRVWRDPHALLRSVLRTAYVRERVRNAS